MMKNYFNKNNFLSILIAAVWFVAGIGFTVYFMNEPTKDITYVECEQWLSYRITDTTHYICYNEDGTYSSIENTVIKQWKHKQRQQ